MTDEPQKPSEGGGVQHLDASTWQRLLSGERFAGEQALAEHLKRGCPRCEEFLAAQPQPDGVDGSVDRALLGLAQRRNERDDVGFARVMRRLKIAGRPAEGPSRASSVLPLALAAGLAIAGAAVLLLQVAPRTEPSAYEGERGEAVPEVTLSFALSAEKGGEAVEKGVPDSRVPEDRGVLLRYEVSAPAFVALLRFAPDGAAEVLVQPGRRGPGRYDLTVGDAPAAVRLRGFVGKNRFAAVASAAPLEPDRLRAVAAAISGEREVDSDDRSLQAVGVAWFDIEVAPAAP